MQDKWRGFLAVLVLLALAAVAPTFAAEAREQRYGNQVSILSGDIHVPADQDLRGLVFSLGGDVTIEGQVSEVVVVFGTLRVRGGEVRGQAVGVFSKIEINDGEIGDQLINVLGSLRTSGAEIAGQVVDISFGRWLPGLTAVLLWLRILSLFVGFVLLLVLAALVPDRIRVIGEEAPVRYVAAFFVGLLTWLAAIVAGLVLTVTVIGIPLALVGYLVLKWMGIGGIFHALGQRIGRSFGREISLLGAILLVFAVYAAARLAPTPFGFAGALVSTVVFALFFLLVEVPGLGLVILTRFGTGEARAAGIPSAAVAPGAPPARPAGPPPLPPPSSSPPSTGD